MCGALRAGRGTHWVRPCVCVRAGRVGADQEHLAAAIREGQVADGHNGVPVASARTRAAPRRAARTHYWCRLSASFRCRCTACEHTG